MTPILRLTFALSLFFSVPGLAAKSQAQQNCLDLLAGITERLGIRLPDSQFLPEDQILVNHFMGNEGNLTWRHGPPVVPERLPEVSSDFFYAVKEDMAREGGRIIHSKEEKVAFFDLDGDLKPVIALNVEATDEVLAHEQAHFVHWKEVRDILQKQGLGSKEAAQVALEIIQSPIFESLHSERRAARAELLKLLEKSPTGFHATSIFSQAHYPAFVQLSKLIVLRDYARRVEQKPALAAAVSQQVPGASQAEFRRRIEREIDSTLLMAYEDQAHWKSIALKGQDLLILQAKEQKDEAGLLRRQKEREIIAAPIKTLTDLFPRPLIEGGDLTPEELNVLDQRLQSLLR